MSQYTDKINAIAEDFATLEYYETLSALEARDGMLIIHYNHGGKKIEARIDASFEGYQVKAGETITIPAHDKEYLLLKDRYSQETWGAKLGKLWKRISNKKVMKD